MKIKITSEQYSTLWSKNCGAEITLTPSQIQEIIEKSKEKKKTRPEEGDDLYIICEGEVVEDTFENVEKVYDLYDSLDLFLDEQEAQEELNKRQALRRIKDFIIENGIDTDVDWNCKNTGKYLVFYSYYQKRLDIDYTGGLKKSNLPYFKSTEEANKVIEHYGEDYKILLGIK